MFTCSYALKSQYNKQKTRQNNTKSTLNWYIFGGPNIINPKYEHLEIPHQKYTIHLYVSHPRDHARTIAHVPHAPNFSKIALHFFMRASRSSRMCRPTHDHTASTSPTRSKRSTLSHEWSRSRRRRGDARVDGHTRCRRWTTSPICRQTCDQRVYNKITLHVRTLFSVGRFKCLDTLSHLAAAAHAAPTSNAVYLCHITLIWI